MGKFFGQHHTTVMHSVEKIEKTLGSNGELKEVIRDIKAMSTTGSNSFRKVRTPMMSKAQEGRPNSVWPQGTPGEGSLSPHIFFHRFHRIYPPVENSGVDK